MSYPIETIRKDFPILSRSVNGRPLVYLDNAATTQTPKQVVEAMNDVYYNYNSNIHRGVHTLSNICTEAFENARKKLASFIHAEKAEEIIFTHGATDSVNIIAESFGTTFLKTGDEILVSGMEHHSNIVPWQILQNRLQIVIKVIPILDDGSLNMTELMKLLTPKVKLIAVTHISNVLGTINPLESIIAAAHQKDIPVMVDGAQAIQHVTVDVQKLDCDFYVFSGHKIYGPTGIGVLYGKSKWLNKMQPVHGGGEMIKKVTFEKTTYNDLPYKFEPGTPNYVAAIGLGAAIDYIQQIGIQQIQAHEADIFNYAKEKLSSIENLIIYGTAPHHTSLISFLLKGIHPFDTGILLDKMGIAVRTGHHCAEPLIDHFQIPGTVRASFAMYNTREEIDALYAGLLKVKQLFG
jgi:cysteine desulfurase/selenocysteine lyase